MSIRESESMSDDESGYNAFHSIMALAISVICGFTSCAQNKDSLTRDNQLIVCRMTDIVVRRSIFFVLSELPHVFLSSHSQSLCFSSIRPIPFANIQEINAQSFSSRCDTIVFCSFLIGIVVVVVAVVFCWRLRKGNDR